jgi:signal transduction histidine kinase
MLTKAFNEKHRLILWLTILLTLGFAATSLVSYFVSRNSIRHEIATNELPLTTDNVYSEIQKDLTRTVFVSSMMAHDTFLRDWILDGERDTAKITKYLNAIQEKYGTITSFLVSEKSRIYYHEGGILKRVSETNPLDVWYFRVRKMSAPYELNLDTDEAHQHALTIFVNYRVIDYRGKLIGVTGVGLAVENLRTLIDQYQNRYQRSVYLVDKQGKIVLHGSEFGPAVADIRAIPGLSDHAATLLSKQEGAYQYRRDGVTYQLNARFIPELGWHLLVEKSDNEAVADIRNTLFLNLAICAAITILVVLLTRMSINRHQARLRQVVESYTEELSNVLTETNDANQVKSEMLAYISHDLRAPLANIVHYTRLLGTASTGEVRHYQAAIEHSVLHQLELIDELTEYARGELEQLKPLPVSTYFYSFLYEIANQGELMAAHQNNRFEMVLNGVMPSVAVIDSKRLKQVLLNLLSNAAKFTSGGDIRLQVDVLPENEKGIRHLRFTVSDTGSGIPEEDRQRIFLPYERNAPNRPGSGLGLAIATQVAHKMGGELRVESVVDVGSKFWFEIALETAQESDVLPSARAFPLPEPFGTGKSILIVEGDSAMRDYLGEVLALADFDVIFSKHMDDAVRELSDSSCDVILITQTAACENIWEFLLKLHEALPGNPPPVILYSATPLQRPEGLPEEIDFYSELLKPVWPEELLKTVQEAVVHA